MHGDGKEVAAVAQELGDRRMCHGVVAVVAVGTPLVRGSPAFVKAKLQQKVEQAQSLSTSWWCSRYQHRRSSCSRVPER